MPFVTVTHWNRRDTTDRAVLGQAAFDLCRAVKAADGVDDARFYWHGPDSVVVQMFSANSEVAQTPPSAEAGRAMFALADLAVRTRLEQWIDPRTGMENYAMAFG